MSTEAACGAGAGRRLALAAALGLLAWAGPLLAAPVLAAPVLGSSEPPDHRALELEIEAAKRPELYLRLDPGARVLEIRARGLTLETVPLTGFAFLAYRPAREERVRPEVTLPAVWTVAEEPAADHRRVIAPDELEPLPDEEEEEEPTPAGGPGRPAPGEADLPPPPASYRVELEGGWELWVGQEIPGVRAASRFVQALKDGWAVLTGDPQPSAHLLALAMEPEGARRLHHLFRPGTRILVVAGLEEEPSDDP